jgi:hypothetical protein
VQKQPQCTLTASPDNINPGDSSKLSWTTSDITSASIDHGVGDLNPVDQGSVKVSPNDDTTYTLTGKGPDGTVHCSATVTVSQHHQNGPSCTLDIHPDNIDRGDDATIRWTTDNATSFSIDHGIGNVHPVDEGSERISPNDDTSYTGTATAKDGRTATCRASINVDHNNGGGGHHENNDETLTGSPTNPNSYVYLSQIPYTGLDLGPVGTVVYWLGLILWCLALTYLALFKFLPFMKVKTMAFGASVGAALNNDVRATHDDHLVSAHYSQNVEEVHVANTEPIMASALAMPAARGYSTYDGFRSYAAGEALSIDDIVKGLSRTPAAPAPVAPAPAALAQAPVIHQEATAEVRSFLIALLDGDRTTVFNTLRSLTMSGANVQAFLTEVVSALDDAYRSRVDGMPVDPEVARILATTMTPTLERLIAALATALDASYTHDATGAKLALTRAFGVIGK